jgi:hypothetical protein
MSMIQRQLNTTERLRRDIAEAVYAMAGKRLQYGDADKMKAVTAEAERIAEAIEQRLRRNWTITERARPARKVPGVE